MTSLDLSAASTSDRRWPTPPYPELSLLHLDPFSQTQPPNSSSLLSPFADLPASLSPSRYPPLSLTTWTSRLGLCNIVIVKRFMPVPAVIVLVPLDLLFLLSGLVINEVQFREEEEGERHAGYFG